MTTSTYEQSVKFLEPIISGWDFSKKTLILSISGPQGSGKSYLSQQLVQYLQGHNIKSVVISSDDIYLNNKDLKDVAKSSQNTLLKGRGLPGTHDIEFGYSILQKLINKETGFKIPIFNKAAFNGEGDRDTVENWISVEQGSKPVDLVIFEGWFNGFLPFEDESVLHKKYAESPLLQHYSLAEIETINSNLDTYSKLWETFDVGIFIDVQSLDFIYDWRIQQEHELIAKKGTGMTDQQVKHFVERYMVVYQLYLKELMENGLPQIEQNKSLKLKLGKHREVLAAVVE